MRDESWALARAFELLDRDGPGRHRSDRSRARVTKTRFSYYVEMPWIVPAGQLRIQPGFTGIWVSRITGRASYAFLM